VGGGQKIYIEIVKLTGTYPIASQSDFSFHSMEREDLEILNAT
jgi:hypothetical protein